MRQIALILLALFVTACSTMPAEQGAIEPASPLVIAHRGASSERPEHTLAAYQLAIDQGADYIEPDLVMTRDGVFVARHENEISGTTDVADHPEFADRRTTKTIDGESLTGWFTEDFTLAELRTLRARERLPRLRPGNTDYDGQFSVPTLAEILELVARQNRPVGIIPEIKHPGYFRAAGLPMEETLVEQLAAAGFDGAEDLVMIQCFEIAPLARLDILSDIRLVQLIAGSGSPADAPSTSYAQMTTPEGLAAIAAYADAIGPDKNLLIPRDEADNLGDPTSLISNAHAAGLLVIPYTFRPENYFLPTSLQSGADPRADGRLEAELSRFLQLGIDGFFTDDPEEGVYARYLLERPALMRELAREAEANGEN
jgi:glycerophosphoryl diester phosphodiesterase